MSEPSRDELRDALAHLIGHLDEPFAAAEEMRAFMGPCLRHARALLVATPPGPNDGERWEECPVFDYGEPGND